MIMMITIQTMKILTGPRVRGAREQHQPGFAYYYYYDN